MTADQGVAHMGDARVGEHPLDVSLDDGDHVAEGLRGDGDDTGRQNPARRDLEEVHALHHSQQDDEGGALRHHRQERGDRRRRALVDVGSPGVAGNERELESEPTDHHRESNRGQGIEGAELDDLPADLHEIRARRRTVQQGHAVGDKGRGERTDHEVLEPRLDTGLVAFEESIEDIEWNRQKLEAEEDGEQVDRTRHDHRTDRCEEHQGVKLAAAGIVSAHERSRHPHGEERGDQNVGVDEGGQPIDSQHPGPHRSRQLE